MRESNLIESSKAALLFESKSRAIHGDKYDYDKVYYVTNKIKVEIFCKTCNKFFTQIPNAHLTGRGCQLCGYQNKMITYESFIQKAQLIHNDKYEYTSFKGYNHKIEIKCKICNLIFVQNGGAHLNGKGCPLCNGAGSSYMFAENFVNRAQIIHGQKYDYSNTNYVHSQQKVEILCIKCNMVFLQSPANHLRGRGCYYCSNKKFVSNKETIWLNTLNILLENRNVRIEKNRKISVDALVENTVYEFYGSYWHGDPRLFDSNDINNHNQKTFGSLFNKTVLREKQIEALGYKVNFLWEKDFDDGLLFSKNHPSKESSI